MFSAASSLDLSRISRDLACSPDSTLQIFLFEAIFKGRTDIVRALLDHDISIINSLDPTGATPLVSSVLQRNVTVCEALLRYKCKVNKRDEKGWTALHHAVNGGCKDIVSVLLKHGAKINYWTRLHKHTPLHIATYSNNLNIINYLKSFNPKVDAEDLSRRTALHLAVEYKVDINILRALLQMGCDPDLMNGQGLTPLMMSVMDRNVNILRELIEHGANINIPDSTGKTPLYVATDEGHNEIIQILFQRGSVESLCSLDGPQRIHSTALHLAIYKEYDDNLISMLLQEKSELEAINSYNQTPLMFAVYIDKKSVVNTLINFGANRLTRDFRGRSPLFFVVKRGDFELCAALLGVLHEFKGSTDLLLSKAIEYNLPDYVQTCIQNGARIMDHHMCSALDILEDNAILNILIDYGKLELNGSVECLEKAVAINNLKAARAILEGNADPNYKSPLARAAALNNDEMVQLLVDFKADTAPDTISGFSALHWASENEHSEALKILVQSAPDPESESQSSAESFLIKVIGNRHSAILEYFIRAKSKSSVNEDNELSEAIGNNQLSIVKRLVNEGYKINEDHRILAERLKDEEIKKYFLTIDKNDLDISVLAKRNRIWEVNL